MTVLLRKEIRSLFPAWILTIVAAVLIAFVQPNGNGVPWLLLLVAIGSLLLGITSFGSEFSQGTFSLLLAQPIPRKRIWRTKTVTLGAALLSVAVMVLAVFVCQFLGSGKNNQVGDVTMPVIFTVLFFGAAFAGGLLSALTTRKMATAFWIALLFPFAVCALAGIFTIGRSEKTINISIATALAAYDVLAFILARRQFLRAQDLPAASGAVVSLPAWMRFGAKAYATTAAPSYRPLRALIAKEFQLHQVSLFFAAVLLFLHVIILLVRRTIFVPGGPQKELYEALGCWWILWFVLPVIIASSAVAEERRQGTLEGSLCLPATRRAQWLIKCAVCFFLAILFGGVMPWLLETASSLTGAPAPILQNPSPFVDQWQFLRWAIIVVPVITLFAFYASSLARSLLHAVGVAIVVASLLSWFPVQLAATDRAYSLLGYLLRFGLPALFALLLWLSYVNFNHPTVGWRLWLQNAAVLLIAGATALFFVMLLLCWSAGLFSQLFGYFSLPLSGGSLHAL